MSNIITAIEKEQLKQDLPEFSAGDTVIVKIKVTEGDRTRLQAYEGVVIGIKNRGINSAFTVRKISHDVGVERTFQTHSPLIDSITVKRKGAVRQSKIYYLRERTGKAARIKEKLPLKNAEKEKTKKTKDKKASKKVASKKETKKSKDTVKKTAKKDGSVSKSKNQK